MGRKHAAALSGVQQAQAEEELRESEQRRNIAERERQLLTSQLGTREQVEGTGQFANVNADTLKYTQRYEVDEAGLSGAFNAVRKLDGGALGGAAGAEVANRANQLLQQAEDAARSGDSATAERLFGQAQSIVGGLSPNAGFAFNLVSNPEAAARIRASSAEARVVGRQLLTAQELGDPNSQTTQDLRGRLLDPALGAIDEGTRNAERAIAAERRDVEGQIARTGSAGPGYNPRAQQSARSQVASAAALERSKVYSQAGGAKGLLIADTARYLNDFTAAFQTNAVQLATDWINNVPGVRDRFNDMLDNINTMQAELLKQFALINKPGPRQGGSSIGSTLLGSLSSFVGSGTLGAPIPTGGSGGGGIGALTSLIKGGGSGVSSGALSALGSGASSVGGAIGSGASSVGSAIGSGASSVGSGIVSAFSAIGSFFSDEIVKTDIEPVELAPLLEPVRSYQFRYTDERFGPPGLSLGFIANDLQKTIPELVEQDEDGVKRIDSMRLIPVLLGAVAELARRVRDLETKHG